MIFNFHIVDDIYIVQGDYELDVHNNFDAKCLNYSLERKLLLLNWERSKGDWVSPNLPKVFSIEYRNVTEFRFIPRDPEIPFSNDDCLSHFGYWSDDNGLNDVFVLPNKTKPKPNYIPALSFESGAIVVVRAEEAVLEVTT